MAGTMTTSQPQQQGKGTAAVLSAFLVQHQKQIELACAKHLTPERMIRMALTLCSRNQKLLECTQNSVLGGIIQAGELGLELSGPLGQCFLIPRWNNKAKKTEAVFQMGYKGYLALAHRSGQVEVIAPREVYVGDEFSVLLGTDNRMRHIPASVVPDIKDKSLPYPDNVQAVYAILRTKGSRVADFEVMTTSQIEAHRKQYSPDSYTTNSGWKTAWVAMAKKTVLTRLLKRAPLSTEISTAAGVDENAEAGTLEAPDELIPIGSSANDRLDDEEPAGGRGDELARRLAEGEVAE